MNRHSLILPNRRMAAAVINLSLQIESDLTANEKFVFSAELKLYRTVLKLLKWRFEYHFYSAEFIKQV